MLKVFSNSIDWLADHARVGLYGFIQLFLINNISIPYEASNWHLAALMLKDVGIISGALLSTITLIAYVYKNIYKKYFRK